MTAAEIQAKIDALNAKIETFAGIRSTSFSDQSTTFSLQDAHEELARLQQLLAVAQRGGSTRYAVTSKGA